MEKIKIRQAIVVEGKYDKIKLSEIIDGVILVTNGFGIYKDKDTLNLIKFYARERGLVILTDSDYAGAQIRGHIKSEIPDCEIINVYVPEIFGKEKRKNRPSKEGKLGVEGIDGKIILEAFRRAGLLEEKITPKNPVTKNDFYFLGLSGGENSSQLRKQICLSLSLPTTLSAAALREAVNTMFDRDEFIRYVRENINGKC